MSDPDFCDPLLTPAPSGDNSALRQRILDRTTRLLRRRLWLRRGAWAAGFAACYLAGMLTMALRPTPPPPAAPVEIVQPNETPPKTDEPSTGSGLEWTALETTDPQGPEYRKAGDRYLEETDLESALRCYTRSLDSGKDAELKVNPDDAWLLILIKDARQKEKNDAKNGG